VEALTKMSAEELWIKDLKEIKENYPEGNINRTKLQNLPV